MELCLSHCGRGRDKGTAVSKEDPVTGGHSSKKSGSIFVNGDSHDSTPLLKTDPPAVEISKLLAEQKKFPSLLQIYVKLKG
jgi:hypothetical protein